MPHACIAGLVCVFEKCIVGLVCVFENCIAGLVCVFDNCIVWCCVGCRPDFVCACLCVRACACLCVLVRSARVRACVRTERLGYGGHDLASDQCVLVRACAQNDADMADMTAPLISVCLCVLRVCVRACVQNNADVEDMTSPLFKEVMRRGLEEGHNFTEVRAGGGVADACVRAEECPLAVRMMMTVMMMIVMMMMMMIVKMMMAFVRGQAMNPDTGFREG